MPLEYHHLNALVSLSYNIGHDKLEKSSILKYINKNSFDKAAQCFALWNKAGGKKSSGLVRRRKYEKEMFLGTIKSIEDIEKL